MITSISSTGGSAISGLQQQGNNVPQTAPDDKKASSPTTKTRDASAFSTDLNNDQTSSAGNTDLLSRQDAEAEIAKLARAMEKPQEADKGNSTKAESAGGNTNSTIEGVFDKKDINHDGIVTFQEELVYSMSDTAETLK